MPSVGRRRKASTSHVWSVQVHTVRRPTAWRVLSFARRLARDVRTRRIGTGTSRTKRWARGSRWRRFAYRSLHSIRICFLASYDRARAVRALLAYAEAVAAGEVSPPPSSPPRIDTPSSVWPHTTVEFVQVTPLGGSLTVEIGYRVAWDEEHTLGARLQGGRLLELCGSVLAP